MLICLSFTTSVHASTVVLHIAAGARSLRPVKLNRQTDIRGKYLRTLLEAGNAPLNLRGAKWRDGKRDWIEQSLFYLGERRGPVVHLGDRSWSDVKGELLEDDGDTPSILPGESMDEPTLLRLPSNRSGE